MSEKDLDEVTYHDASACFSEEEWDRLQEWQKELCRNVMKEIQRALVSLGPLIATTVSSLKAKEQQGPACIDNLDSQRRLNFDASSSDVSSGSNKSLSLKQPQTLHVKTEQHEIKSCLSRVSLKKDKEGAPILIDHVGEEVKQSSTDASSGIATSFSIKDEDPRCMYVWDSTRKESISHSNNDGHLEARKGYRISVECKHQSATDESYSAEVPPEVVQGCIEIDSENTMCITSDHHRKGDNSSPGESGSHHRLHSTIYQRTTNHKRLDELSRGQSDMHNVNTTQPKSDIRNVNIIQPKSLALPCWSSYSCSGRDQTFAPTISHVEHQRMHTEKVQEIYRKCEKSFSAQPFKEGSMMHSGNRPYHCTICGKSFNNKGVLQRHQIIHTGERPYECSICGKRFGRKGTLVRHQIIHLKDQTVIESETDLQ